MTLREWAARLAGTLGARRSDADLQEELRLHLDLAAAANEAQTPRSAGLAQAMDALRDQRSLPWLDDLVRDVRHGLRLLQRSPLFAAAAVTSLALGIGSTSAMFSLADAALLRPLPVRDPGAVVTISASAAGDSRLGMSYPNYLDLRDQSRSFDGMVAYQRTTFSFARTRQSLREMRLGMLVSDNFFDVLDIQAAIGRTFLPREGILPGRDAIVVLGYDFWNNVLGRGSSRNDLVWINGIEFTVIGITPERFTGMDAYIRPAFYVPAAMADRLAGRSVRADSMAEGTLDDRAARTFVVKARLKPGISRRRAEAELAVAWKRLEQEYPAANSSRTMAVRTELQSRAQSDTLTAVTMTLMLCLAAIVLLISCANVASLLLGRARARSREIAVRLALGVGRARLARQLLTESLLLALVAALPGLGLAYAAIALFSRYRAPSDLPIVIHPELDQRALTVAFLSAALSAVLFGLVPARRSLTTQLVPALKDADPVPARRSRTIGRNILVIVQVALSMALLVATAMLVDGFRRSIELDPGFRTERLLMMSFDTSFARYTRGQTHEFYRRIVDRARNVPGVVSTALTSAVPLDRGGSIQSVMPEGYQSSAGQNAVAVFSAVVDEGFFGTMKIAIVRGRSFTDGDIAGSPRVAIVNEEFARLYWPNRDPIGQRLRMRDAVGPWLEVVGVARTGKYLFVGEPPRPFLYLPFAQNEQTDMSLIAESAASDAAALASPLGEVVRSVDVNQPVFNVRTVNAFYERRATGTLRQLAGMVGAMGGIGLVLALVGLYGLVAYTAARRTREIGIRMAVGAAGSDVMRMVLRQGLVVSLGGIAAGTIVSIAVARALRAITVGLGTAGFATYAAVPVVLVAATLAASYVPARRASQLDPVQALRCE